MVDFYPEQSSCGPDRRSRLFAILDVALLRLRRQKGCGLGPNRNLTTLNKNRKTIFQNHKNLLEVVSKPSIRSKVKAGQVVKPTAKLSLRQQAYWTYVEDWPTSPTLRFPRFDLIEGFENTSVSMTNTHYRNTI